jgi:uncharacterized OB-fold protein
MMISNSSLTHLMEGEIMYDWIGRLTWRACARCGRLTSYNPLCPECQREERKSQ